MQKESKKFDFKTDISNLFYTVNFKIIKIDLLSVQNILNFVIDSLETDILFILRPFKTLVVACHIYRAS